MSSALEKQAVTRLSGCTFKNRSHLNVITSEAQGIVSNAFGQS